MQRQNLRVFVKQRMPQIGKHFFRSRCKSSKHPCCPISKKLLMLHGAIPNMCALRDVFQEDSVQRYNYILLQNTCDLQHLLRNQILNPENIITTQIRLILDSSGFLEIQK